MYSTEKSILSGRNRTSTYRPIYGLTLWEKRIFYGTLITLMVGLLITNRIIAQTQPPPLKWKKTYPVIPNSTARIMDFTYLKSNHSYYVLGKLDMADCVNDKCQCDIYTDSDTSHNGQVLYQLDETGNIIKKICIGNRYLSYLFITTSNDNNLVLAGGAMKAVGEFAGYNIDTITSDKIVIKIDTLGNVIWRTHLPGLGFDELNYVYNADNDHVFVLVNRFADADGIYYEHYGQPNSFDEDSYVIEIDETGNIIWSKAIGGTKYEVLNSIIRLPNNDIIVGGMIEGASQGYYANSQPIGGCTDGFCADAYVVYLDSSRNLKWNRRYGGNTGDGLRAIIPISDEKFLLISVIGDNATNTDIPLWHTPSEIAAYVINKNGNIINSRTFGGNYSENISRYFPNLKLRYFKVGDRISICASTSSKDGDVIPMYPQNLNSSNFWVLIIDTSLNIVNSYCFGSGGEYKQDIALAQYFDENHLTIAGRMGGECLPWKIPGNHNPPFTTDIMLDINQYTLISEIRTTPLTVKVIPNPVRNRAIIQLEGEHIQDAAWLKVYDINGNVVLRQQIKQSVEQIDVSKMPAGTYVYEVLSNIGQQLFNGKIIVLH